MFHVIMMKIKEHAFDNLITESDLIKFDCSIHYVIPRLYSFNLLFNFLAKRNECEPEITRIGIQRD